MLAPRNQGLDKRGRALGQMASGRPRYSTDELSPKTWEDFERLFRKPGEWSNCQCMWFHRQGPRAKDEQRWSAKRRNEKNFQDQRRLVESGQSHGVLVYAEGDPIGWCQYGHGDELPRADRTPGYGKAPRGAKDVSLWRITCFCVDKRHRRRGVARVGLHAAVDSIRKEGGGEVEAYPTLRQGGAALHRGTVPMFKKEGFRIVAHLGKNIVLMRLTVSPD